MLSKTVIETLFKFASQKNEIYLPYMCNSNLSTMQYPMMKRCSKGKKPL